MFCSSNKSFDYHFEGFQVLVFVNEPEGEAATYTIAVTEDFAPFNSKTLLHSPFLSYQLVITTLSSQKTGLKHSVSEDLWPTIAYFTCDVVYHYIPECP